MRRFRYSKECTPKQRVNSIEFEISLWENVKLVEENGQQVFKNAEYIDDKLFPLIKVGGYNEANGIDEEFVLECFSLYEYSRSEWEEEYEYNRSSPAYPYPEGALSAIHTQLINLKADLEDAKELLRKEENMPVYTDDDKEERERLTDQTLSMLMDEWKERFAQEKEKWDKEPKWSAKMVSIDFMLNGIKRTLYPNDFPFEDGPCYEGFIESIQRRVCNDLKEQGAFITDVHGMMD